LRGGFFFGDAEGEFDREAGDGAKGFFDFGAGSFVGEAGLIGGDEEGGFVGFGVEGFDFAAVAEDCVEAAGVGFEVAAGGGPEGGEVGEVGYFFDWGRGVGWRGGDGAGAAVLGGGPLLFELGVFGFEFFFLATHGRFHLFVDGFFGEVVGRSVEWG